MCDDQMFTEKDFPTQEALERMVKAGCVIKERKSSLVWVEKNGEFVQEERFADVYTLTGAIAFPAKD